jgi:hypothetical protein
MIVGFAALDVGLDDPATLPSNHALAKLPCIRVPVAFRTLALTIPWTVRRATPVDGAYPQRGYVIDAKMPRRFSG